MNLQVKIGDQTFNVEVGDLSARPVLATIDGETFEVWPEEATPAKRVATAAPAPVVEKAAPSSVPVQRPAVVPPSAAAGETGSQVVSAPIPGAIVAVLVKPGDAVIKGQELISLEAMKMKNAIRATRDGRIAAVLVNVGDHVQKGRPLLELSD